MKKTLLLALAAIQLSLTTSAQTDSSASGPQVKLSVNYNSYLNFYGRTDEVKSSGFFPLAELWLNEHWYLNAAPVFVNNATQNFDYAGTITTAGYQHLSDKWFVNAYAMKPFYESSAQLVQSALQAQTGVTLSRITPLASFTLGGDVKFSGQTDYGASAGIDKAIRFAQPNQVIVLNPSLMAFAGTQRFTNSYNRKKKGPLGVPAGNETVTTTSTQFNLLAYEASLPIIYVRSKWTAMLSPSYVVPQNLLTVPGRPELSEKGTPTFYLTANLKYSF